MQPAFRSIFRCYLLSPFVTLSAGGVGLSFKSGGSKPRFYDQGKSDAGRLVANGREFHLHISRPSEILVDGRS